MATTQLADIYEPLTFASMIAEAQLELNRFISSGIAVVDQALQDQIATGGQSGELTNFNPLGTPEPNYSNDVPGDTVTPNKIDSAEQRFRICLQNQVWSTMNISRELALADPVTAITSKIGQYWATTNERRIINHCLGVLADDKTNDSGSMVITVGNDSASAITDAERISAEVVLDAEQTLGDHMGSITGIAMHSVIYTRLRKQNLIDYIPNARGEVNIPTYLGKFVIVDDSMPAVPGTNRILYTCILFGSGVFGLASGRVIVPSETDRKPENGNGGGEELLYTRRSDLIHMYGIDYLDNVRAGQSTTFAELADGTNWNKIWDRKHLPIAYIEVND